MNLELSSEVFVEYDRVRRPAGRRDNVTQTGGKIVREIWCDGDADNGDKYDQDRTRFVGPGRSFAAVSRFRFVAVRRVVRQNKSADGIQGNVDRVLDESTSDISQVKNTFVGKRIERERKKKNGFLNWL